MSMNYLCITMPKCPIIICSTALLYAMLGGVVVHRGFIFLEDGQAFPLPQVEITGKKYHRLS